MPTAAATVPTLTIAGQVYAVERADAPSGFRVAVRLTRVDRRRGLVAHVVAKSGAHDLTCSCEAFSYRRDRSELCKHIAAATSAGIL